MVPSSMRRRQRGQWRYFVGLSVLGLLLIASATHASEVSASPAAAAIVAR